MLVLVDTYNVLHVVGVLPPDHAGIDSGGLARLIGRSRYAQEKVVLVCDGTPPPDADRRDVPCTRHVYSGPRWTADDAIAKLIERSTARGSILVVSSDNEVIRNAKRSKARVIDSPKFLRQLVEDVESINDQSRGSIAPPPRNQRGSTDDWIQSFQVDPDTLDLPAAEPPKPRSADPREQPPAEQPTRPARRPLEDVEKLEEIDLEELERLDLSDWLDGPPPGEQR
ncbi:MAG: hypothetical protein CMJ32_11540 [Phycisphaerae bacterium]|nr:hypothetical protein [Phycisphaerae bacterium]